MDRRIILAAGGIVLRGTQKPQVAIVQLRKYRHWVLPKGKLKRNETARSAAKREVLEETGHRVAIQEFLGAISYESRGKPKIVQFWRMQALASSVRDPATDIKEVRWLSVKKALQTLSFTREQIFLRHVMTPYRPARSHRSKRFVR